MKCIYCGKEIGDSKFINGANVYCSYECKLDEETSHARMRRPFVREKEFAREQMLSVETGKLDEALNECKTRGIDYATYQKQKTLKMLKQKKVEEDMEKTIQELNQKISDQEKEIEILSNRLKEVREEFVLSRIVDGESWPYGKYRSDNIASLLRAVYMMGRNGDEVVVERGGSFEIRISE